MKINKSILQTPNESFFSQKIWPIEQIGYISFEVFLVVVSIYSKFVASYPLFMIFQISTQPFFLQKAKIFIHFTGFSTWDSDMELGCRKFGI